MSNGEYFIKGNQVKKIMNRYIINFGKMSFRKWPVENALAIKSKSNLDGENGSSVAVAN